MTIEFIEAEHRYLVNGHERPSVTRILQDMQLVRPYEGDPWYGVRGSAVHLATHLLDQGTLDWTTVDPAIKGFVEAYAEFKEREGWEFEHSEERLSNYKYKYCGTPDRFMPLIDIKCGDSHEPLQLEAYAELIRENYPSTYPSVESQSYFLRLYENGKSKITPYKLNFTNRGIFLSAVTLWHEQKRRGMR